MASKERSEKVNKYVTGYVSENYDRLNVRFRKDLKMLEVLNKHAEEFGYVDPATGRPSKAEFARRAIETQLAIDRGELKLTKQRKKKEEK